MGRLSRSPPRPVGGSFSGPLPVLVRDAQHDLADVASGIEAEVIDLRTLSPLEQHIEPRTDKIIAAARAAARVTSG